MAQCSKCANGGRTGPTPHGGLAVGAVPQPNPPRADKPHRGPHL